MKIKVIRGFIKHDDAVYGEGKILEIDDKQALAIISEGVAEEVQEVAQAEEPEKEAEKAPAEKKADEKPEVAPESGNAEPSLDWTRSELVAHATSIGIENADKLGNKEKILAAIQEKGVKTE